MQTLEETIIEWNSKRRKMGCVAAAEWLCKRQPQFKPVRVRHYLPNGNNENGQFWEHVVCSNGHIEIDLAPYANKPKE